MLIELDSKVQIESPKIKQISLELFYHIEEKLIFKQPLKTFSIFENYIVRLKFLFFLKTLNT